MKEREEIEDKLVAELAEAAKSLGITMERRYHQERSGPTDPDTIDYRRVFRPLVKRALILAVAAEARKVSGLALTERMTELVDDMQAANEEETLRVSRSAVVKRIQDLNRELAEVDRVIKGDK